MNSRTTGRATSASSRATRTSRRASSMSFSDSTPRPESRSNTEDSRSVSASNNSNSYGPNAIDPRGRSRRRGASPPSSHLRYGGRGGGGRDCSAPEGAAYGPEEAEGQGTGGARPLSFVAEVSARARIPKRWVLELASESPNSSSIKHCYFKALGEVPSSILSG